MKRIKPTDTGVFPSGSRADHTAKLHNLYVPLRRPEIHLIAKPNEITTEQLLSTYKIKAVEFGRWVNYDDRLEYLNTMFIALHDLNQVLKLKNNLGFSTLTISFGARGNSPAAAHYEPSSNAINLTRFRRTSSLKDSLAYMFLKTDAQRKEYLSKENRFETTGGISSFAHEYGHFLDFFFGGHIDQLKTQWSLTLGHSLTTHPCDYAKGTLRHQVQEILQSIIWEIRPGSSRKEKHTKHYQSLKKFAGKKEYWIRQAEIFARAFEVYVFEKLAASKITSLGLTHNRTRYKSLVYIDEKLRAKVNPKFDQLINSLRKIVVNGEAPKK